MDEDHDWRAALLAQRKAKDEFFAGHAHSPIPHDARPGFEGLAYYPPDPAYRIVVALGPGDCAIVRMPRTGGDVVEYERVGTFEIALPGGTGRLTAFASDAHEDGALFIPFRDATSGSETYGAGRYLETERIDERRHVLDFNTAYHPYCAYDERFTCPIPPPENRLRLAVRAGERLP